MSDSRVIFVGMHNKPHMRPLDIGTKTGKLIRRIVKELPEGTEVVKTNLYDIDHFPNAFEMHDLKDEWYWTHLPVDGDVIVLLGQFVHKLFSRHLDGIIKVAHPASKWSHKAMDEYVTRTSEKIIKKL